jgi:threonine/homoserine/homoserine lactone efflux protein
VIEHVLFAGGFAFAAAVQPGPLQAFLFAKVAEKGVKATLPASLAPVLSDGPIAVVVLLVLGSLPQNAGRILQAAGGLLLMYLAWAALRQWRNRGGEGRGGRDSTPHTLMQAVAVNVLNPNPYLGWSLVLGPRVLSAWHQGPENAIALVVSFYVTMVAMLAFTILMFGSARFLGARGRRTLILLSGVALGALGMLQLASSLSGCVR